MKTKMVSFHMLAAFAFATFPMYLGGCALTMSSSSVRLLTLEEMHVDVLGIRSVPSVFVRFGNPYEHEGIQYNPIALQENKAPEGHVFMILSVRVTADQTPFALYPEWFRLFDTEDHPYLPKGSYRGEPEGEVAMFGLSRSTIYVEEIEQQYVYVVPENAKLSRFQFRDAFTDAPAIQLEAQP